MRTTGTHILKLRKEEGVALITVIILTAVLMVMGAGMYMVASREGTMSTADYSGGQAFYYAEGGIENVMNALNFTATESQLTQLRADQSADGHGYLMDPIASNRQNPTDPVVMNIGRESYTVWVDEVDENGIHCTGCGLNPVSTEPAYLLITAEGQSAQGFHKLQQRVKLVASSYPLGFYINGDVSVSGNPTISNESMYIRGSLYNRNKLTLSGNDLIYGGGAGVKATGTIYASGSGRTQIYTETGAHSERYWNDNYMNDRDSRGPTGNTFSITELEATIATPGLSATQLAALKQQAMTSGYYNGAPSSNLTLQQGDIPSHDGDLVVYVEYPTGSPTHNEVNIKFEWPHSPYTSGKVMIIVKNGSVKLTGTAIGNTRGAIYCPDGEARADGSGGGTFTGYIWSMGLTNIGNFNFSMDTGFVSDPPFFAWTVTRETAWTEVDG
jgi:Tfp pilus assembly protein PilX